VRSQGQGLVASTERKAGLMCYECVGRCYTCYEGPRFPCAACSVIDSEDFEDVDEDEE
jgi:hypothetical protein